MIGAAVPPPLLGKGPFVHELLIFTVATEKSTFQNMFSAKRFAWWENHNKSAGNSNSIGLLAEDAVMATNI